jgi:pimeloyl-ACP methyl ester carboxylesterase
MQMFYRQFGNAKQNIVIAHGLYGCSDNWVSTAKILAQTHNVFAVDLRNHGRSPHSNEHTYTAMSNDLAEFIISKNIEKPIVIGHSMGGRCVALLAKQHPDLISKIIIVDISPFDCDNKKQLLEFHTDILNVLKSVNLQQINSRHDAKEKISEKIKDKDLQNFLLKNLYRTLNGNFFWKFNLPVLLNNVNNMICGSLNKNDNYAIKNPALLITGEKSNYVVNSDIEIIASFFTDLKINKIADAGHWIHAEQPEKFIRCVQIFINTYM